MGRKLYELTENDLLKCSAYSLPSDEWFKANRGRKPWGLVKRDWILANLKYDIEYVRGLWQGRVDCARGLEYSEERNDNHYNLGYYRGYTEYHSNRYGWDAGTRERFDALYVND